MRRRSHGYAGGPRARLSVLPLTKPAPALALSLYYFAYFAYVGAYSPYITLYLKEIGLAAAQIGILYAVPQVMRIVGPGIWGALSDRSGDPARILRQVALASLVVFAFVYVGSTFAWLLCVLVAMHLFTSAQMPLLEAITIESVRDAPGRYGHIRVWGSIGFIVSVMGLGCWLDHTPVDAVLHWTCTALAMTVVAAWLLPRAAPSVRPPNTLSVARVLARPEVRAFLVAGYFNAFAHAALYTFYSIYLDSLGYSKSVIGIMWALGIVIEIVVFRAWPQITRRFDLNALFFWTFVVCALRFLLIAWLADTWWILVLAQLMHASTFALYHASAVGLVGRYFGADNQARGQAIYISTSYGLGGFCGSIASGLLWDKVGPHWTYTLSALAGALGALVLRGPGQRESA